MTTHHPIACTALQPIGVPSSRPRIVSMIGVNGYTPTYVKPRGF
jgi:hypothetical protein